MDWLLFRTIGILLILMVMVEVNSEFIVEVKELDSENGTTRWQTVKRQKREWIKFAAACREGEDNSKRNPIAKIRSDCESNQKITYRISGAGIDRPPFGVFTINPRTGEINITSVVDREMTPMFLIYCRALNSRGEDLERPLELRVKVMDVNDNPPVFTQNVYTANIEEHCAANTLVVKLSATDADEENHLNSKIAYKIISQEPSGSPLFILNRYTGEIRTMTNYIDREEHSTYSLVKGSDRDGAADGLSSECECRIKITDVNDNFPTLEETSYSASIEENCLSSELIRFQAIDRDEENTDNWLADFFFVSGNDENCFEIHTDPRTNEGVLKVVKMLDYEQMPIMLLSVGVKNKAEFHPSVASHYRIKATPVRIQVINVREGSIFNPNPMTFKVQEGLRGGALLNYVLGKYTATDLDTGTASTNVRYIMGHDPASWLKVDSRTGEIQFSRDFDPKSKYIIDGIYTAQVLAVEDAIGKTATGTICVEVPDFNDFCPVIFSDSRHICLTSPSIMISTRENSFGSPFTYCIADQPPGTADVWDIRSTNGTSAILTATQPLSLGLYQVPILVRDSYDRTCESAQIIQLEACECDDNRMCSYYSSTGIYPGGSSITIITDDNYGTVTGDRVGEGNVGLGPAGIGLIVLGILTLLLMPLLLLLCCCKRKAPAGLGTRFAPVPEGGEGVMQSWGIEGAHPEDRLFPEIYTNTYAGGGTVEGGASGVSGVELNTGVGAALCLGAGGLAGAVKRRGSTIGTLREYAETGMNMAFLDSYFSEKAYAYADEDECRPANDCLLIYDHEGMGSPVGSIGCCSWIVDDLDDSYLETLGPKFRTLAEICLDTEIEPFPSPHQAWIPITTDLPLLGTNYIVNESSAMSLTEAGFQAEMAMPDPMIHGDIIVTESYSTSDQCVQPTTIIFEPQLVPNVLVTETVMAPAYAVQGNICVPAELANTHNVIYAERVVPSPGMTAMSNSSMTGGCMAPGMSGSGMVGPEIQMTQMVSPDVHVCQTMGSPMTSRRRVTQHSTVQYFQQ
uniref:Desmoglein 4 n=1 Tax=Monodelphis domestica TaxID=13616 RepID=A0A5F8GV57_MONDO